MQDQIHGYHVTKQTLAYDGIVEGIAFSRVQRWSSTMPFSRAVPALQATLYCCTQQQIVTLLVSPQLISLLLDRLHAKVHIV